MSESKESELDVIYQTAYDAGYGKGFNDGYSEGIEDFSIVMQDTIYNKALDDVRDLIMSAGNSSEELITSLESLRKITYSESGSYITD